MQSIHFCRARIYLFISCLVLTFTEPRLSSADIYGGAFYSGATNIERATDSGTFVSIFKLFTQAPAMAWGPEGRLYAGNGNLVRVFNAGSGALENSFTVTGANIWGMEFAPNGDLLVSSMAATQAVYRVNPTNGSIIATIGAGTLVDPHKLLRTTDGNMLVGSRSSDKIYKIDLSSNSASVFASGSGLNGPQALDYGPDGNIYALNTLNSDVYQINPITGNVNGLFTSSGLTNPFDLLFVGNRLWTAGGGAWRSFDATTGGFLGTSSGMNAVTYRELIAVVPEPSVGLFLFAAALLRRPRLR